MPGSSGVGPIAIREAVPGDAEGIARTFVESSDHHVRLDPERYWTQDFEAIAERYREGRQHPRHAAAVTLVAERAGEIAGFLDARLERPSDAMHREAIYCYIAEFAVREAYQRRGIGAQLLRAAEDWGRGQGAEFASLEYNAANSRAAAFYRQRMGYRVAAITAIKRL